MMKLNIRFMSGDRVDETLTFDSHGSAEERLPYILETEAFSISLSSEIQLLSCKLVFQGVEYSFSESLSESFEYHLNPARKKSGVGYEALFFNYFGVVSFDLAIVDLNDKSDIISFPPMEVLARKITADQTASMIDYILNESGECLHSCFSPTSLRSKFINGGDSPQHAIEKLKILFTTLDDVLPLIYSSPIKRLATDLRIVPGTTVDDIGAEGVAWLSENISVLSQAYDPDEYHIEYGGERYFASELQTSVVIEHTDIYENRLIHGFLMRVQRFLIDFEVEINRSSGLVSGNVRDGYVSFFSTMNKSILGTFLGSSYELIEFSEKIRFYISQLNSRLPVSYIEGGSPIVTQKVKGNRAYLSLYRAISKWYDHNKVDWRDRDFMLAIKSIPKLFEYYTVLKVKKTLNVLCDSITDHSSDSLFDGVYQDAAISLYYEPVYWMTGHENYVEGPVRSEVGSYENAMRHTQYISPSHRHSNRVPDIVIRVKLEGKKREVLLVLDAKYSTMKLSYKTYLPKLTMKYVHGISLYSGVGPVQAMVILCPNSVDTFADFHAPPYGLYEDETVFPVLGVQGVSVTSPDNDAFSLQFTVANLIEQARISLAKSDQGSVSEIA